MEKFKYNTIDEAIAAIKAGQMVLVTDDEDRENEGRCGRHPIWPSFPGI